jgi:endonuclease/exonuclease/phosphatase family metal-dependent hydrolase
MAKERKKGRLALALGAIGAIGSWAAFLATLISPSVVPLPALAGLGFPVFGVLLLFGVLMALRFGRWRSASIFVLTVLVTAPLYRSTWGDFGIAMPVGPKSGPVLKCMSWNVRLFDHYGWLGGVKSDIMKSIEKEGPNVLCLQEHFKAASPSSFPIGEPLLMALAGGAEDPVNQHLVWAREKGGRKFGVGTWTTQPIVRREAIRFGTRSNNVCAITDVVWEGDTLRVFNVHFASLHFDSQDYEALEGGVPDAEVRERMWSRMKQAYALRVDQVKAVLAAVENSPHPVLLCGDFNDTPVSWTLSTLRSTLRDAHDVQGFRMDGTWQGAVPGVRIDHVLVDPSWEVLSYQTGGNGLSDHRFVAAELRVLNP